MNVSLVLKRIIKKLAEILAAVKETIKKPLIQKWIAAIAAVVLCISAGVFFSCYIIIGGNIVSVYAYDVDLSDEGLTDVSALARCKQIRHLYLRGNEISTDQFDELSAALPGCDIRWDVPIGAKRYDCKYPNGGIINFEFYFKDLTPIAVKYVEDLENARYFRSKQVNVTGSAVDDERLHELNMRLQNTNIYWTVTIDGGRYKTNATKLNLKKANLLDPTVLKYFTKVEELRLNEDVITDLTVLEGLTDLQYLDISGNDFSDISPLTSLRQLNELRLANAGADGDTIDLAPLAEMSKLNVLNLKLCNCTGLEALAQIPTLKEINLTGCGSNNTDYSFIADMTQLESFTMEYGGLLNEDLKYFSGLTNLTYLDVSRIYVTDPSPLYSLTNLKELHIRMDGLSDEEQQALSAALPDCKIYSF